MRIRRPLALVFSVVPIVSLAVVPVYADEVGTLTQELALAKKAGLPVTPAEMIRPLSPNQNAAPLYRELVKKLARHSESKLEIDSSTILARTKPTDAQLSKARSELAERSDVMKLIHKALSRADCEFQRDWSKGPNVLFPEYGHLRNACRWLTAESGMLLWQGKPIDAVNNMALGFRLAQHAAADRILISHLVGVAIDAITLRGLENILYHAGDKPGVAEAVASAIEGKWKALSASYAISGEGVLTLEGNRHVIEKTSRERPSELEAGRKLLDRTSAINLSLIRRVTAKADKPYPDAEIACRRIAKDMQKSKDPTFAQAAMLSPTYAEGIVPRTRDIAKARTLLAAARLMAFRQKNGRVPARLDELMKPAPVDPFDLKPLRYRAVGNGFMVWSVGPSGRFAGNAATLREYNQNAVFRWPMPEMLKAPPAKN